MEKTLLIIGAGIAGLSAGCYGRMNGCRTRIFEMHDKPGGLCTSWKRNGYTIDGCLHWLVGSAPGLEISRIWEELGAVQGREMINHEEFGRYEGNGGKTFIFYTDLDRLEQHMLELSPTDKTVIKEFINGARAFTQIDLPALKAPELFGPVEGMATLWKMRPLFKWKGVSVRDFAVRFRDPFLSEALGSFSEDFPMPLVFFLLTMAWMHQKVAGYPSGGSLEFARAIERRYLALGGEINYRARVVEILAENNRAAGVRLADGSVHRGEAVISAADGHTTIFEMLAGKYVDDRIRGYYRDLSIFSPLVHVAVGVNYSFSEVPFSVTGISFPLDEPLAVAGKELKRLTAMIYNFDPTLAPPGRTVVKVMFSSDYDYWRALREDGDRYRAEKERIAGQVVARLDRRFPGLAAQVEMQDVATPATFHRYTGNWRGSFEGWLPSPDQFGLRMRKTLPGLDNFYMCGQWVEPGGGLPPAAMSGRNVIQLICKKDKREFTAGTP
ncbi:MAG: NAD(P)/FAD-dependent oxidoreductase [Peptococcaceae bacterium]|nr:MAG: NAD(P)/FAD-dependent oxidoreductase [Peptococcaceae bacterium]